MGLKALRSIKGLFGSFKGQGQKLLNIFTKGGWRSKAQQLEKLSAKSDVANEVSGQFEEKLTSIKEDIFSIKKPKSLNDYYHVGSFLLAKKIGNIMLIIAVALSLWYVISILMPGIKLRSKNSKLGPNSDMIVCFHDAKKLKNYTGLVRAFSRVNGAVYEGALSNGVATGLGVLRDESSELIYSGDFKNNKYNGKGTIFYSNGEPKFIGEFLDNQYNGKGELRAEDGKAVYIGNFVSGLKSGRGVLYNDSGQEVFNGLFSQDHINLTAYLGRTISGLSGVFTGERIMYNCEDRVMINYPEVDCILVAERKEEAIDELGKINKIFVMPPSYYAGTSAEDNRLDLEETLPGNFINGFTKAEAEEMSVIDSMRRNGIRRFKNYAEVAKESVLEGVFNLTSPYSDDEFYVSRYKISGFIYTFYFEKLDGPYIFYSIERLS